MSSSPFVITGFREKGTQEIDASNITIEKTPVVIVGKKNLKDKKELCQGCQNNEGAQNAHMDCKTGCLHNPEFCDFCSHVK